MQAVCNEVINSKGRGGGIELENRLHINFMAASLKTTPSVACIQPVAD